MKIVVKDLTDEAVMRRACDMTRNTSGGPVKPSAISRAKLLFLEHSPVRLIRFWVELHGIPAFVSTHLVRHKIGVEHFVETHRDDRGGSVDAGRMTLVKHGMEINAAAMIAMAKKRLCYASHRQTVAVMTRIRNAMPPDMADHMAPECVYRGYCPEARECKPGLRAVLSAYSDSPMMKARK